MSATRARPTTTSPRSARYPLGLEFRAAMLRDVVLPDLRVAVASPRHDPEVERVFVRTLQELEQVEQRLTALRHPDEPPGSSLAGACGRVWAKARRSRVRLSARRGRARASAAWRALLRRSRRRFAEPPARPELDHATTSAPTSVS